MNTLRIATRTSTLAMHQTNLVADKLRAAHPGLDVEIVGMSTKGDRVTDVPLPEVGGKGLFTRELEDALLAQSVDLAVHSLKDLPFEHARWPRTRRLPQARRPLRRVHLKPLFKPL